MIAVEVNDVFEFVYKGNMLTNIVLKAHAEKEPLCLKYTYKENYSMRQRLSWILDILNYVKEPIPIPIPNVKVDSSIEILRSDNADDERFMKTNSKSQYHLNAVTFANIVSSNSDPYISVFTHNPGKNTNTKYCYQINRGAITFDKVEAGCFIFGDLKKSMAISLHYVLRVTYFLSGAYVLRMFLKRGYLHFLG